jgi:hypothetical protein
MTFIRSLAHSHCHHRTRHNSKLHTPHLRYCDEALQRAPIAAQAFLLSTVPGLQRKALWLYPLFNFFAKPFVVRTS